MPTDEELIQQYRDGDTQKFGELYDKYVKKIYNFIYYRTHHKETAEDLTGLAFTKALENLKQYNPQKGAFSSWIYRIAKNVLYDHYRSSHPHENIDDVWDLKISDNLAHDVDTGMKLEKVRKYLKTLKPDQRDLLIMRLWDGMAYREIAALTGKSEESLKVAFSRAISKIRSEEILTLLLLITAIWKIK